MKKFFNCGKIEIRESPIEGLGVFATEDIPSKTLLEEVPFILFPRYVNLAKNMYDFLKSGGWLSTKEQHMENLRENLGFKEPERYYFKWHPHVQIDNDSMWTVLPLGYGAIYNSSNTANNTDWKLHKDTFTFTLEKDVKKDDELFTFYGYFMGDNGTIFNCESVFHLAIDLFPNSDGKKVHKVKALRFGSLDTFHLQRQNPAAHRIHVMLNNSVDGLTVKRLNLLQPSGDVVGSRETTEFMTLSEVYKLLSEAKASPAPLVAMLFEYTDKKSGKREQEEVIWKK